MAIDTAIKNRRYPIFAPTRLPVHSPDSQKIPSPYQGRADNTLTEKMKRVGVGSGFGSMMGRTALIPSRMIDALPILGGGI